MNQGETRTERAYQQIRSDILSGVIKPGAPLQFAHLKSEYGASMGVLREALTRLAAEGLATNQAQHGFRVMQVSLDDLIDLTNARCLIEGMVLKDAVLHGDLNWESQIVASHHRLENTPKFEDGSEAQPSDDWVQAHHDFHVALCSAATSDRLKEIAASLRASAEVYRRWSMPFEIQERDVSAEHRELVGLCIARKAEAASEALKNHLNLTKTIILDGVEASNN